MKFIEPDVNSRAEEFPAHVDQVKEYSKRYDDPPAGMDQIDWPAYMALLYVKGYDGGLSIEPRSEHWRGKLGEKAIDFTVNYFTQFIFQNNTKTSAKLFRRGFSLVQSKTEHNISC